MKSKQLTRINGRVIRMALVSAIALGSAFSGVDSYAAGSTTSSIAVSATVNPNCLISAASLGFGAYDPISSNATADLLSSATLNVTCTSGSAATVALDQGMHPNTAGGSTDSAPMRQMANGSNMLSYNLYSNSIRSNVWGNTVPTSLGTTGTGSVVGLIVYGSVPAGQNKPAGSYNDTVQATINF